MIACLISLRQDRILHTARAVLKRFPSQFVPSHSFGVFFISKGMCEDPAGHRKQEAGKFQIHVETESKAI